MIILHCSILDEQVYLWGEKTPETPYDPPVKRGRKPKNPKPRPFPYDAGYAGLNKALKQSSIPLSLRKKPLKVHIVWLPTRKESPIPSSPVIAETNDLQVKITLNPWSVSAYPLSAGEAVDFLASCTGKKMVSKGVLVGTDAAWLTETLRFAGSLVARQRYLPDVSLTQEGYTGVWEPVITGEDSEYRSRLANAMPPVIRSMSEAKMVSPPEQVSAELLTSFIRLTVDYLVRFSVNGGANRKTAGKTKQDFKSVHDAWLYALRTFDRRIKYNDKACAQLMEHVAEWRRPVDIAAASPFRVCFRLEEPEESDETDDKTLSIPREPWYIRYLVQPYDDPSLLMPLDEVWKPQRGKRGALKRFGPKLHEHILSSLGQAAGICLRIADSLKTAQPSGYELTPEGVHEFLTEKALILEQAGFGVMLPAWWTRTGTKTRLAVKASVASPKLQGGGGMTLDSIVQVNWDIALGGERLTPKELEELARMKTPLVRVRGQWVEVKTSEIQQAIDFWKRKAPAECTAGDIVKMAVGASRPAHDVSFAGVDSSGWIEDLIQQLDGQSQLEDIETPETFSGTLRPYQKRGYSWLAFLRTWGFGACLADDMGLGKTIQTLALIQLDRHNGVTNPVLLACPTSVVNNWRKEAERFTPDVTVLIHHGTDRHKGAAFKKEAKKHALVITSYGLMQRDMKLFNDISWAGIVLDEAQNIKNPETKKSRAARSLHADYRIALTGTPVENNVGDLWSIMEFLNPGLLDTQAEFKRRFFIPIQAWRDEQAAERLKRITGPFILRRLKTDKSIITDLPEKMEMKVYCTLTKEQASLYEAILKETEEALVDAEAIGRKGLILATLSKLKQVCNHPAQFLGDNSSVPDRSGKVARLTEMLEEIIEAGDRALLFSQFSEMGGILQRCLQDTFGREVLFLHGAVPKKKRDRMVERFQSEHDAPPIFILSLKAGGTGLNLTNANHVFHFDRWWNPAVENQATDRAFRIGQKRNVQVHKFICAGTLEEKIDEMIERKKEVAEKVVGTGEGWLTELSNDELKNILTLDKNAVQG